VSTDGCADRFERAREAPGQERGWGAGGENGPGRVAAAGGGLLSPGADGRQEGCRGARAGEVDRGVRGGNWGRAGRGWGVGLAAQWPAEVAISGGVGERKAAGSKLGSLSFPGPPPSKALDPRLLTFSPGGRVPRAGLDWRWRGRCRTLLASAAAAAGGWLTRSSSCVSAWAFRRLRVVRPGRRVRTARSARQLPRRSRRPGQFRRSRQHLERQPSACA
jgi:hypothetical protein